MNEDDAHEARGAMLHRGLVEQRQYQIENAQREVGDLKRAYAQLRDNLIREKADHADLRRRYQERQEAVIAAGAEVGRMTRALKALVEERDVEKAAAVDAMHHATEAIRERDAALARAEKAELANAEQIRLVNEIIARMAKLEAALRNAKRLLKYAKVYAQYYCEGKKSPDTEDILRDFDETAAAIDAALAEKEAKQ